MFQYFDLPWGSGDRGGPSTREGVQRGGGRCCGCGRGLTSAAPPHWPGGMQISPA